MVSLIIEVSGIIALGGKNCKTNNSIGRKCLKYGAQPFSNNYSVLNKCTVLNNSVGWKKTVKLIIVLVGNVPNNSIGWISIHFGPWISTIFVMNQLKFYKRV